MATIIFGLWLAWLNGYIWDVLKLGAGGGNLNLTLLGFGMWFGIIMWFNVWFVIWPNQKVVLGLVEADAEAKPKAAATAKMFSRINTLLSIPMFFGMLSASHFG